jgi:hypothetical protein
MISHEFVKAVSEYSILPLHLLAVSHYLELAVSLSILVFTTYVVSTIHHHKKEVSRERS